MGEMTELVVTVVVVLVALVVAYVARRQSLIDRRAKQLAEELAAQQQATERLAGELALHREFSQALIDARRPPSAPPPRPTLRLAYDHTKGRLLAVGGAAVGLLGWVRSHPLGTATFAASVAALMFIPSFSAEDELQGGTPDLPPMALPDQSFERLRPLIEPPAPAAESEQDEPPEGTVPDSEGPEQEPETPDAPDAPDQAAAQPAPQQQQAAPEPSPQPPPEDEQEPESPRESDEEPRAEPNQPPPQEPSCSIIELDLDPYARACILPE